MMALSVISKVSCRAETPASSSQPITRSGRRLSARSTADTFNDTFTSRPWVCQSASCRIAAWITQRVRPAMLPLRSARGMNSPGETMPNSAWRQRSRTSA